MSLKHFIGAIRAHIRQGISVNVFHRDTGGLLVVNEVVDADDILVSELEAAFGFAFQLIHHRAIEKEQLRKKFEGHISLQNVIACQPNDAHSTTAQDSLERIAIK